jgi:hypothetical protein
MIFPLKLNVETRLRFVLASHLAELMPAYFSGCIIIFIMKHGAKGVLEITFSMHLNGHAPFPGKLPNIAP